jgi:hypothetical protein
MDKLREEIARKYHNLVMNEFLHTEKDIHIDKKRLVSNLIDRKQELSSAILKLFKERMLEEYDKLHDIFSAEDNQRAVEIVAELRKKVEVDNGK